MVVDGAEGPGPHIGAEGEEPIGQGLEEEEQFYDAEEDAGEDAEEDAEEEQDEIRAETVARLSSAVQERLRVQMSEDQLQAVRALLERQQQLADGCSSDGDEGDEGLSSGEEVSEDEGLCMEQQQGRGQTDSDTSEVQAAGEFEWQWAGGDQQEVPLHQYDHPDKIPKLSKTDWYKANSERKLYEGAALTILQSVYYLMAWKADYAVTDKAFEAMLGMLCQLFLPKVRFTVSSRCCSCC